MPNNTFESHQSKEKHLGLQHDNTHTTHLLLIRKVLVVDASGNRSGAVVVQVEVKLAVTRAELELLEEHRVVVRGERVEDVKLGLS
jgi:hypothetical protein